MTKKIEVKIFKTYSPQKTREMGRGLGKIYETSICPSGITTRRQIRSLYKKLEKEFPSFALKLDKKCISFWGSDKGLMEDILNDKLKEHTYKNKEGN
ncbi:MAG: hypothetical protein ABIK27_03625 [Bacteroidota bacterium]|uniref:Uncharacterized protein n=1 Tax=viral metagenome TaxID=1070528 RepID=A0A6M3MFZ4_9ZZZZ